jgi:hypothetical protein
MTTPPYDTRRVTEELKTVRDDLELLSAMVTPDNKIAHYLIDRLRVASDNVAGCVILAEHDLAPPLLIVGRSIVEGLFVTYWATYNRENAEIVLRRERQEILRVLKNQIQGAERVAKIVDKTTGRDITDRFLADYRNLGSRLNIEKIAKECGLNKIYEIAYRTLSLPAHGNDGIILSNPSEAVSGTIEMVRCMLRAIHMIVGNYIREHRVTSHDDILKLMFPAR